VRHREHDTSVRDVPHEATRAGTSKTSCTPRGPPRSRSGRTGTGWPPGAVGGTLALLPQGLALVGTAAGQQGVPGRRTRGPGGDRGSRRSPGDEVATSSGRDGGLARGVGEAASSGRVGRRTRCRRPRAWPGRPRRYARAAGGEAHAPTCTRGPTGSGSRPSSPRARRGSVREEVRSSGSGRWRPLLLSRRRGWRPEGSRPSAERGACGVRAGGAPVPDVRPDARPSSAAAERVCLQKGRRPAGGGGGVEHPSWVMSRSARGRAEETRPPRATRTPSLVQLAHAAAPGPSRGEEHADSPRPDRPAGVTGEPLGTGPAGEDRSPGPQTMRGRSSANSSEG
jgi:hypothetical protein